MAATKLTIRNDGSVKVEGDFEMVDPEGKAFGLGGAQRRTLPLRPFRIQAVLRRLAQEGQFPECHPGVRSSARNSEGLDSFLCKMRLVL